MEVTQSPVNPDRPVQPSPGSKSAEPERTLWEGKPSHIMGLGMYFLAGALVVFGLVAWMAWGSGWFLLVSLLGLGLGGWKYLVLSSLRYRLTTERLVTTEGFITRKTDEVELYRVKDTYLLQPIVLRLMGLGNVVLMTSDQSTPQVTLPAIRDSERVRQMIRQTVEAVRTRKGVKEVDMH